MDPASTSAQRTRQILEALQGRPEGVTRQDLQLLAGLRDLDEQAMRRLLAPLVERGAARVAGQTKARRYYLGRNAPPRPAGPPLSEEGQACRVRLALPRPGAFYRPEFLDGYRPNETAYLARAARLTPPGPDPGTPDRVARQRILVDLAWDSARLEGSTYSLAECRQLVEGTPDPGKPLAETQMLTNIRSAIEFMMESGPELTADSITVRNLSALLTENLLADPADEGRLRTRPIALAGTGYRPPDSPGLIQDAFERILGTAPAIADPVEQSFFLLVQLLYLQPFSAGNGTLARLCANIPLFARDRTPVCFMEAPAERFTEALLALWEQNEVALLRDLFLFALERSCARLAADRGNPARPDPFRLRYRAEIRAAVRAVVLAREAGGAAEARIRAHARTHLPGEARAGFLVAVETELASLHDGNFARYHLQPSEFAAWKPSRPLR
jgi:hypothetical protein